VHEEQLSPELGRLIDAAKAAAARAGAGPARAEGAAALVESGGIFVGHSGEDLAAEPHCAVARAFEAAGGLEGGVLAIAVANRDGSSGDLVPCGACRAFLATLDPELPTVTKQLGRWILQPAARLCAED